MEESEGLTVLRVERVLHLWGHAMEENDGHINLLKKAGMGKSSWGALFMSSTTLKFVYVCPIHREVLVLYEHELEAERSRLSLAYHCSTLPSSYH